MLSHKVTNGLFQLLNNTLARIRRCTKNTFGSSARMYIDGQHSFQRNRNRYHKIYFMTDGS